MKTEAWHDASVSHVMPETSSQPPDARKRQGRILPRVSERAWPCPQLNFGLLAFITMGK